MVIYETELYHYGRKGMKWGQHIFGRDRMLGSSRKVKSIMPEGYKNLKKARTANLEKFGKTADTNVCYIAGYSGSGKSTTARYLARKNDKVIHLDLFFESVSKGSASQRDSEFVSYLNKKLPSWKELGDSKNIKRHSKEYWALADQFGKAIDNFGREQFKKGNRVIAEGVQIADDMLTPNKSYYVNKPVIILSTNPIRSMSQAFERDGRGNLAKGLASLDSPKEYVSWFCDTNKKLSDLSNVTNAKRAQEAVEELLKQGR